MNEELQPEEALGRDQLYQLFLSADADGNGTLDKDETKELFIKVQGGDIDDQTFTYLWNNRLDKDGNGSIDFDEFYEFLNSHEGSNGDNDPSEIDEPQYTLKERARIKIIDEISSLSNDIFKLPKKESLLKQLQKNDIFVICSRGGDLHRCRSPLFDIAAKETVITNVYNSIENFWNKTEVVKDHFENYTNDLLKKKMVLEHTRDLFIINEAFESERDRLELRSVSSVIYWDRDILSVIDDVLTNLQENFIHFFNKNDAINTDDKDLTILQLQISIYFFMGAGVSKVSENTMKERRMYLLKEAAGQQFLSHLAHYTFNSRTGDKNIKFYALKLLAVLIEKDTEMKLFVLGQVTFNDEYFAPTLWDFINQYLQALSDWEQEVDQQIVNDMDENNSITFYQILQIATYVFALLTDFPNETINDDVKELFKVSFVDPLYIKVSNLGIEGSLANQVVASWKVMKPDVNYILISSNILRFIRNVKKLQNKYFRYKMDFFFPMTPEEISFTILQNYANENFLSDEELAIFLMQHIVFLMELYFDYNEEENNYDRFINTPYWNVFYKVIKFVLKLESSGFHSRKEKLVLKILKMVELLSAGDIPEDLLEYIVNHVHSDSEAVQREAIYASKFFLDFDRINIVSLYLNYIPRLAAEVPIFKRRDLNMYSSFGYSSHRYNIGNITELVSLFKLILSKSAHQPGLHEEASKQFSFCLLNEIDTSLICIRDEFKLLKTRSKNTGYLGKELRNRLEDFNKLCTEIQSLINTYIRKDSSFLFTDLWEHTNDSSLHLKNEGDFLLKKFSIPEIPPTENAENYNTKSITIDAYFSSEESKTGSYSTSSSSSANKNKRETGTLCYWTDIHSIKYIDKLELTTKQIDFGKKYVYIDASKKHLGSDYDSQHVYRNPLFTFLNPDLQGFSQYLDTTKVIINGKDYKYGNSTYPWVISDQEGCVIFKGSKIFVEGEMDLATEKNLIPGKGSTVKISFWRTSGKSYIDEMISPNEYIFANITGDGFEVMELDDETTPFAVILYDYNDQPLTDIFEATKLNLNMEKTNVLEIKYKIGQHYHMNTSRFEIHGRWSTSREEKFVGLFEDRNIKLLTDTLPYYVEKSQTHSHISISPLIKVRLVVDISQGKKCDWNTIEQELTKDFLHQHITSACLDKLKTIIYKSLDKPLYITKEVLKDVMRENFQGNFTNDYEKSIVISQEMIDITFNLHCDHQRKDSSGNPVITDIRRLLYFIASFLRPDEMYIHGNAADNDLANSVRTDLKCRYFLEFYQEKNQKYSKKDLESIIIDVNRSSHALHNLDIPQNHTYFMGDEFQTLLKECLKTDFLTKVWYWRPRPMKQKRKQRDNSPPRERSNGSNNKHNNDHNNNYNNKHNNNNNNNNNHEGNHLKKKKVGGNGKGNGNGSGNRNNSPPRNNANNNNNKNDQANSYHNNGY